MSRNWCFTSYIKRKEFRKKIKKDMKGDKDIRYIIFQKEKCPTTGRLHLQGYVELNKVIRMAGMKKLLGPAHWGPRQKTRHHARNYCLKAKSKVKGPWEYGEWKAGGQGTRNDIKDAVDMIKDKKTKLEIIEEHPATYVKYFRGLEKVEFELNKKTAKGFRKVDVHVIWGKAGSGKTRFADDKYGYEGVVP